MPIGVIIAVHWLHVLFAIFWFGSVLINDLLVIPSVLSLPISVQGQFGAAYGPRAHRMIVPASGLTILFGILRGALAGVFGALTTPYGITWMAALLLAIALSILGARFIGRLAAKLPELADTPGFEPAIARIKQLSQLELIGFLVIFSLMIAMRFGY